MKYIYLFLVGVITLFSCKNTTHNSTSVILDAERNDSMFFINTGRLEEKYGFISNYFKKVNTIVLESNNKCLISEVSSLQILGDSILILDKLKSKGVYLFNKSGRYIKQIAQIGNGPNEYLEPTDFTIDTNNRVLYILDSKKQEILVYDLKNSLFLKSLKLQNYKVKSYHLQYSDNILITDSYYYMKSDSSYLLQEIDLENGKCVRKWLTSNQYNKGISERVFTNQSVFFDRNKAPKFVQQFMDTVILLDSGRVTNYFALTGSQLTAKELHSIEGGIIQKINFLISVDKAYHISDLVTFRDLVYFNFKRRNLIQTCIYNIKTNKYEIFNGLKDDLIYKDATGILPNLCFSDNHQRVYSVIDQTDMERFCHLAKSGALNKKLHKRETLMKLSPDANPIIFIYE